MKEEGLLKGHKKSLIESLHDLRSKFLILLDNNRKNSIVLADEMEKATNSLQSAQEGNEQLSQKVLNIAEKTSNQLEDVRNLMDQINAISNHQQGIFESVTNVESAATNTLKVSHDGKNKIDDFTNTINDLTNRLDSTEAFISQLQKRIEDISTVNHFILSVSENLSLLSLNASIEAARAGEFGKGFAVVAEEITHLSNTTQTEVKKIDSIIRNLLVSSQDVENSLSKSISEFSSGKETFSQVSDTFEQIGSMNNNMQVKVHEIFGSMQNENKIIEDTRGIMSQLLSQSEQVASETELAAAITEENVAEITTIHASIENSKAYADLMEKIIDLHRTGISPVEKKPDHPIRIGALVPTGVELFDTIYCGMREAKRELAKIGTTIDIMDYDSYDYVPNKEKYFKKAIEQNYDGYVLAPFGNELDGMINDLSNKGIPVVTYNNDSSEDSKRLTCVYPDAYATGVEAARLFIDRLHGHGNILVITEDNPTYNLRLNGFMDGLKNQKHIHITDKIVNPPYPNDDLLYTKYLEYFSKHQKDYQAIFHICYGHLGFARALTETGLADKTINIIYDLDANTLPYLKSGVFDYAFGQNALVQGRDSIMILYNYMVAGITPDHKITPTAIEVYSTKDAQKMVL